MRARLKQADLSAMLAALDTLGLDALRARWQQLYGSPPPPRLSQPMLRAGLAYRLQEQALGRLRPAAARWLSDVARRAAKRPPPTMPKPGTRLLRVWQGRTYEVIIEANGIAFDGRTYRSLSEVARLITGARWSGPRFFGLLVKGPVDDAA